MSTFEVQARRVTIAEHPDADALELAQVDGYMSVVPKGRYQTGELAVYIPEQAIVPEDVITALGLEGRLAGSAHNRVKAIRLRGVLSQGLIYQPEDLKLAEGEDYGEALGISKWVPPVPINMAGKTYACPEIRPYTEIENLKRFPGVLAEGEEVVATEKLHGTCTIVYWDGERLHVTSKGIAKQGLALEDLRDEAGASVNAYWKAVRQEGLEDKLRMISEAEGGIEVTLYGETLGVQDLRYGFDGGRLGFRAFDLRIGAEFTDASIFVGACMAHDIPLVPLIYKGPYSDEAVWVAASGREQVTGAEGHIREGVVVRPLNERSDPKLGRVIVKAVSDAYLLRKGDTTEFE